MNKKIYIAPVSEVVMIETLQFIADSIPMDDTTPADGSGMESKAVGFIVDDDEDL